MTGNQRLEPFDRRVREHWEQQGYDVVPGDGGLVATRDSEMRLLETYPDGGVTEADIDDAVSRLIESTEMTNITLVVGGEVPSSLREAAEQWDVTLVGESELRGAAAPAEDTPPGERGTPADSEVPPGTDPGAVASSEDGTERAEVAVDAVGERRTLARETGAFVLEAVLVLLLAGVLGVFLLQVLQLV